MCRNPSQTTDAHLRRLVDTYNASLRVKYLSGAPQTPPDTIRTCERDISPCRSPSNTSILCTTRTEASSTTSDPLGHTNRCPTPPSSRILHPMPPLNTFSRCTTRFDASPRVETASGLLMSSLDTSLTCTTRSDTFLHVENPSGAHQPPLDSTRTSSCDVSTHRSPSNTSASCITRTETSSTTPDPLGHTSKFDVSKHIEYVHQGSVDPPRQFSTLSPCSLSHPATSD